MLVRHHHVDARDRASDRGRLESSLWLLIGQLCQILTKELGRLGRKEAYLLTLQVWLREELGILADDDLLAVLLFWPLPQLLLFMF